MALTPIPSHQSAAKSWCYTLLKEIKFSFKWTIDNFSDRPEKIAESFESLTFSDGVHNKMRWRVELYPKGLNALVKDFVAVYVHLVSCDTSEVQVNFKLSIINDGNEQQNVMRCQRAFVQGKYWGWQKFISRDCLLLKSNGLLPRDNLTLHCEISVPYSVNIYGLFRVPESHLSEDLGQVLDSRNFTDVILCVNGCEFAAHKAILAARSPVFSAMFEHEMEEKRRNRVEIIDMSSEVMAALLQYIYTDKFPDIENVRDLLFAADKYALDRLKIMCEDNIASNLSISNAAEVLLLADMHSADQLKAHVIDFICMHAVDVMDSPGWQAIERTRPHLITEAFRTIVTQQIEPPQKRRKL